MGSAVLCVINDGKTAVCSTFGRRVVVMDARNSLQKITDMLYHRSAVFDLVQMVFISAKFLMFYNLIFTNDLTFCSK